MKKLSPAKPTYTSIRSRCTVVKIPERCIMNHMRTEDTPEEPAYLLEQKLKRFPQRSNKFRLGLSYEECVLYTES